MFQAEPDQFDLAITDMSMPDMTVFELAKVIIRTRPELPIILCIGFSENVTIETVNSAGAQEVRQKPFNARNLTEIVSKVLNDG